MRLVPRSTEVEPGPGARFGQVSPPRPPIDATCAAPKMVEAANSRARIGPNVTARVVSAALRRLLARLPKSQMAQDPSRELQPCGVACAYLLLLPALVAGALRASTGAGINFSLTLSLVGTTVLAWFLVPRLLAGQRAYFREPASTIWWCLAQVVPVVASAIVVKKLANRDFSGFMNVDGWDGGSHLFLKQTFVHSDASAYNGFVGQYALSYALEQLFGCDPFRSTAIAVYAGLAICIAVPAALLMYLVDFTGSGLISKLFGAAAGISVLLWIGHISFLPVFHYLQAMGFYPQVFALVPVSMLWFADAISTTKSVRLLGVAFCVLLTRYTYGLNLPDILAALGVLALLDAGSGDDKEAPLKLLVAAGFLMIAAAGYKRLAPIFAIWGGIGRNSTQLSLAADIGQGLVVACAVVLLPRVARDDGNRGKLTNVIRFPIAMLIVNSAAFCVFAGTAKQTYYLQKYQSVTLWLVGGALAITTGFCVAAFAGHVSESRRNGQLAAAVARYSMIGLLVGSAIALGSLAWREAFAVYRASYLERVDKVGPPYRFLRPLVDRKATRLISASLTSKKKVFGGYITGNFPAFSFMNGYFGYHSGMQAFFSPKAQAGYCVFWVASLDDTFPTGDQTLVNKWRSEIGQGRDAHCIRYRVSWKTTEHSLCERCY